MLPTPPTIRRAVASWSENVIAADALHTFVKVVKLETGWGWCRKQGYDRGQPVTFWAV